MAKQYDETDDEYMTVTLTMDDGSEIECFIVTILEVDGKDYIYLTPTDEENDDVYAYGYSENPDDPNEEPVLSDITDDDEFEAVLDAFDEWQDNCEFDEM